MKENKQKRDNNKDTKVVEDIITVDGEKLEEIEEVVEVPQIVKMIDNEHLVIQDVSYTLIENYRDGFNAEALNGRYHEVLDKYDYIVGDWGFEQLRLKGFFKDDAKHVIHEKKIQFLQDYLYEFCNFGCAYFVIQRDLPAPIEEKRLKSFEKRHNKKRPINRNKKVNNDKKAKKRPDSHVPVTKKKKDSLPRNKNKKPTRNFQIKEREQVVTPKSHKVPVKEAVKAPVKSTQKVVDNKKRKKKFEIRETK